MNISSDDLIIDSDSEYNTCQKTPYIQSPGTENRTTGRVGHYRNIITSIVIALRPKGESSMYSEEGAPNQKLSEGIQEDSKQNPESK